MMNATCQEIQRVIETVGPKGLPDDMPIHEHLQECDTCQDLLAAGTALDEAFDEPETHDVSEQTVQAMFARVEEIESQPEEGDSAGVQPWWKRRQIQAMAASIALVTVVGGLFAVNGSRMMSAPSDAYGPALGGKGKGIEGERSTGLSSSTPASKDDGRSSNRPVPRRTSVVLHPTPAYRYDPGKKARPQRTPVARNPASGRPYNSSMNQQGAYGYQSRPTATPAARAPALRDQARGNARFEDSFVREGGVVQDPAAIQRNAFFRDYGTNPTIATKDQAISTFAVDVDTGSYSIARSYLERGQLPPHAAIRVEEFINAFDYAYEGPENQPFSVSVEAFPSPNREGYHVLHVGLKGKEVSTANRKAANLVFVIDVSGSMNQENRLGLVKQSLTLLVDQLDERDSVGIVVYGTNARTVLEPIRATAHNRHTILQAIHGLHSEGSTNAAAGIQVGYAMAARNFRKGQINRVVLCSDGVANQGITNAEGILAQIGKEARRGITISTVGFGMNTYNDVLMEQLADKGNGNYAYVDRLDEAHRIFVQEMTGTLQVIAKDVKVQMEFDPKTVRRYRLLGFENRSLTTEQFDDDKIDAGEIGAGHAVTAIYEVKLTEKANARTALGQLRLRYKKPNGRKSTKIERELPGWIVKDSYEKTSPPTKLSMVAGGFAEKLRGSYWARTLSYDDLLGLWAEIPPPLQGRKDVVELRDLIVRARQLDTRPDRFARYVPIERMDFDKVPVLE